MENIKLMNEKVHLLKGIIEDVGWLDKRFVINRGDFFHPKHRIVEKTHFKINDEEFYKGFSLKDLYCTCG